MENLYTMETKSGQFVCHMTNTPVNISFLSLNNFKLNSYLLSMYTTDVYSKSQNLDLLSLTVTLLATGSQLQEHISFTSQSTSINRFLSSSLPQKFGLQGEPNCNILTKSLEIRHYTKHFFETLFIRNECSLYLEKTLQFHHQLPFFITQFILYQ